MGRLNVFCFGERAGVLYDEAGSLGFAYDESWVSRGRPPLSHSLPVDGSFAPEAVRAFFAGLLPEGEPRRQLARDLGVSERNDYALLEAVGGDCPGAVSLYATDPAPAAAAYGEDVEWLDDEGLARLIRELPARPMLAEPEGEIRLSLAGAQDKLPVVVGDDGRVGTTSGRTPSTHILKTPISRLDDTVTNEAFCLRLAARAGLPVAAVEPRRALDEECLLVQRYDRAARQGTVVRLHQEDFCQALGIESERKYQAEGGPGLKDCFDLVRSAVTVPAPATLALLDVVAFNFVLGNNDAHAKNFSLLYRADSAELAPFYDLLSTVAYNRRHNTARKMAMKIGGEYRRDWVRARHWERFFEEAGLGAAASLRRLRRFTGALPGAARDVAQELRADGWGAEVVARIIAIVEARSHALDEMLAPAPRG